MSSDEPQTEGSEEPSGSHTEPGGLATAPPPPAPTERLPPELLESYVRAAIHRDREPGVVVAVCHPLRMYKVPRGLFEALEARGFEVQIVETHPDRVRSATQIRDALLAARDEHPDRPLDVLVFSGDGSLDHHVLVAAFWAFCPDLVAQRPGAIRVEPPDHDDLATVDPVLRRTFLEPLPDGEGLEPDERTIHQLWVTRSRIEGLLRRGRDPDRIARRAELPLRDERLRVAVVAALLPHRVTLRAHGFDLSGLAAATRAHTFQGLYPFIRSIAVYPAGTAADNALYAGVPGWSYAQLSRLLVKVGALDGLRQWLERRTLQRFVEYFTSGVVVPARFSVVAFDGDWQVISSHTAGGPSGGRFFQPDLEAKTGGLLGYLARIPSVVVGEGLLGSTIVRVRAFGHGGLKKVETAGRLVEAMFSNRAFIAGVGSVPSTNPTSFAGQSSLVVGTPLWYRGGDGGLRFDLRGLLTFTESIGRGLLGRTLHFLGLGTGRLASGGRFWFASPEQQIALTEGEVADVAFLDHEGRPRFVPTQVSGDPFQATTMTVRVAWGPLPLLANVDSLLLAAAQQSLARLRQAQSLQLQTVFIGGLPWFRHTLGPEWTVERAADLGVPSPPRTLSRNLEHAQRTLIARWRGLDTGAFVDTTEQGLALGRRGRYAHNGDQSAHLALIRERGTLMVRQVRRDPEGHIVESRTSYRRWWGGWVIHDAQLRRWEEGGPRILYEERYFRDAQAFHLEAPAFFPFIPHSPAERVWAEVTEEAPRLDVDGRD